jgi:hypothetical protein
MNEHNECSQPEEFKMNREQFSEKINSIIAHTDRNIVVKVSPDWVNIEMYAGEVKFAGDRVEMTFSNRYNGQIVSEIRAIISTRNSDEMLEAANMMIEAAAWFEAIKDDIEAAMIEMHKADEAKWKAMIAERKAQEEAAKPNPMVEITGRMSWAKMNGIWTAGSGRWSIISQTDRYITIRNDHSGHERRMTKADVKDCGWFVANID